MSQQFTYRVYVPSHEKYYRYDTFDNTEYLAIIKYIQNNDTEQIVSFFHRLITDHCHDSIDISSLNCVDKFVILLNIRIMSIADRLEITTKVESGPEKVKNNVSIDLYDILDKVTNHPNNKSIEVNVENMSVEVGLPLNLYNSNLDDLIVNVLLSLNAKDKKYDLTTLSSEEKNELLDNLPGDILQQSISYIKNIDETYKIPVFESVKQKISDELRSIELKVFDNSMFELLKSLYNSNLEEQYYIRYIMVKHMNYSLSEIDKITPIDTQTYINMYRKEIEDQKKAQEKSSKAESGGISLPNPGFV